MGDLHQDIFIGQRQKMTSEQTPANPTSIACLSAREYEGVINSARTSTNSENICFFWGGGPVASTRIPIQAPESRILLSWTQEEFLHV